MSHPHHRTATVDDPRLNTTPLWVPLLVAGLGLAGTILGTVSGVLLTQRRSDRREALNWKLQREREREAWAREDVARTFEHRRQAYGDFYVSLKAMALRAYNHGIGRGDDEDEELPEGWHFPTFQRLQHLELYATPTVAVKAGEAYTAVWRWGHSTKNGEDDEAFYDAQEAADYAEQGLLVAIRADLSIPGE